MEAAQALERTDQTAPNRRDEASERIVGLNSLALRIQHVESRPAGRTGIRLRVETAIRWILILRAAIGGTFGTTPSSCGAGRRERP